MTEQLVEFKYVKFGYTPENPLMTDVSFSVKPGQKIAIVGPTGAGKTTLINLLMRFYEIDGGEITVDGINTKEMTRHELRKHFGMVLQDSWLFEGTIRDNLKYSTDRKVSLKEIKAATKSVYADSFIRTMPGGYNMVLSKGAGNISQGQRQLLTIARAIIADPEIMILDEATSNVDANTEQAIQNAMAVLLKGRTSFVIAHRLSTIRDANVILYMENGDCKITINNIFHLRRCFLITFYFTTVTSPSKRVAERQNAPNVSFISGRSLNASSSLSPVLLMVPSGRLLIKTYN